LKPSLDTVISPGLLFCFKTLEVLFVSHNLYAVREIYIR
jgi:hypothetical protein